MDLIRSPGRPSNHDLKEASISGGWVYWRPFLFRTMQPASRCLLGETGFSAGTALVFQHRAQRPGAVQRGPQSTSRLLMLFRSVYRCGGLSLSWAHVLAGTQPLRVVAAQATRRERTQRRHQSIRNKVIARDQCVSIGCASHCTCQPAHEQGRCTCGHPVVPQCWPANGQHSCG